MKIPELTKLTEEALNYFIWVIEHPSFKEDLVFTNRAGKLEKILLNNYNDFSLPRYTDDWGKGGPLIFKHHICINYGDQSPGKEWFAMKYKPPIYVNFGSTPLIAAMRCIIACEHGEEVRVPA